MAEPSPDDPKKGSSTQDNDGQRASDQKSQGDEKPHKGLKDRPLLIVGGVVVLLLALLAGVMFWLHSRHFQSTDDAFVDTHMVRLAPQVAGRVTEVHVNDNQFVKAGELLITLDSADAQTRVAQARAQKAQAQAQLDNAEVQISVNQAGYGQALADLAAAQAQADNTTRDLARYRELLRTAPAAVAKQQLDQAVAAERQAVAQRDAAAKAAAARADQIKASRTQVTSGKEQVRADQSLLDQAGVNLGYTRIYAPVDGHVAQKSVEIGNYAQAGTQLLAIVPTQLWVTANFKETQLALMRRGQPVEIKVDACPKDKVTGHVDSIQRGAGQAFGILPPENATGNFVKVVQRVPVKIVFDHPPADCPLGPGLSVTPVVRVR